MYVFMLFIYSCYQKGLVHIDQHENQYFTAMHKVVLTFKNRASYI